MVTTELAALNDAIKKAGGPKPLADLVGVTKQVVNQWRLTGRVSAGRARVVSYKTGVPLYRLRPDLYNRKDFR